MQGDTFKLSYKTKTGESPPLAIYNCGVQRCPPGHTWGPGVRDHYLIHHVMAGCGRYTAGGVTKTVRAGDTFIVYPSAAVQYTADETDPWEYCWVGFNGAMAGLLISRTPFSPDLPVARLDNPLAVEQALMDVNGAFSSSGDAYSRELRSVGYLYIFLALLTEQASSPETLEQEYVETALRYIAHNFSRPTDVSSIASGVGISRSHLYRVFMRQMSISPNEYLTRYRISQACELLQHSSLPVSAVAASVGYGDPLYFSRAFKKITGLSPSAYAAGGESSPHSRKEI